MRLHEQAMSGRCHVCDEQWPCEASILRRERDDARRRVAVLEAGLRDLLDEIYPGTKGYTVPRKSVVERARAALSTGEGTTAEETPEQRTERMRAEDEVYNAMDRRERESAWDIGEEQTNHE